MWNLVQDNSCPESTDDPAGISHIDTHTPTSRSRGVSVASRYTESKHLHSALSESQRGKSELRDILV